MIMRLSPSKLFLVFWLALLSGLLIGSYVALPLVTLGWLTALWAVIFISGQQENIEVVSLSFASVGLGMLLWQATSGESWLHISYLVQLSGILTGFRDSLIDKISLALPEPHGSLLVGILFGNKVKLDPELVTEFRVVGISHLIAVSGYNLTILASNTRTLTKQWLGKRSIYLSFVVILLFVVMTGASSSVLRAAVMVGLLLLAELLGRPNRSLNILVIAAGVLAIFQPKIVADIGFQLSVAATYGLIRLSPVLSYAFRKAKLPKPLIGVLAETLAATIMTAPLLILHFERLSTVSPLTNLLVVPLVPLLMALGIIGVVAVLFYAQLGRMLLLICWPLLEWTLRVSHYLSLVPKATILISIPVWALLLVIAAFVLMAEHFQIKLARVKELPTL